MKNLLSTLFNHERYQTIAIIVAFLFLGIFYGCQPQIKSILDPSMRITRAGLDAEIEVFIAKANIGYASLERQEKLQELLFQQSLVSVSTGAFNPIALMTSVAALLGVGAVTDNVRKRKEIKILKP